MRKKIIAVTGGLLLAMVLLLPAAGSAAPGAASQGTAGRPVTATARVLPAAALGPAAECLAFTGNSPQTREVTDDFARTASSTVFTTLPCGSTAVSVPRGRSAVIVAKVDAEVSCQGPAGQWCIGRVLIGGVEGEPNAPEPDSFAWATARADLNQWESNAFTRTRRVTCPRSIVTTAPCRVTVVTQVRTHAAEMLMRIDDRTLDVLVSLV